MNPYSFLISLIVNYLKEFVIVYLQLKLNYIKGNNIALKLKRNIKKKNQYSITSSHINVGFNDSIVFSMT